MPKGYSLHIGLNRLDPGIYLTFGDLLRAEQDACDMAELACRAGYEPIVLKSEEATCTAVKSAIEDISRALNALGDDGIFLLTYSGHGSFVLDSNFDEDDGRDETWCLYDRQIPDDTLFALLAKFRKGIRIVVVSDSCRSGTAISLYRAKQHLAAQASRHVRGETESSSVEPLSRGLPESLSDLIARRDRRMYSEEQEDYPLGRRAEIEASVLLLSACQDWEKAYEGDRNGVFTSALIDLHSRKVSRNYLELHEHIHAALESITPRQHPNYMKIGRPSAGFELQTAFEI